MAFDAVITGVESSALRRNGWRERQRRLLSVVDDDSEIRDFDVREVREVHVGLSFGWSFGSFFRLPLTAAKKKI